VRDADKDGFVFFKTNANDRSFRSYSDQDPGVCLAVRKFPEGGAGYAVK
jgi:hypothetical protein